MSATPSAGSSENPRTRPHRGTADERARSDERGRRDRSEVPVDVDERVHEERGQQQRERELVPAAMHRAAQQHEAGEHEQREPDQPELREHLHRQVVRLDRVVEIRLPVEQVQQVERAGAVSPQHVVGEAVPRLAPPGEAEVRARRADPPAAVPDRPRADPVHRDRDDRRSDGEHAERDRRAAQHARVARPRQAFEHQRDDGAHQKQRAEHEPVAPADVQRLVVARHAGQSEADPADDGRRQRRCDQRHGALEPLVRAAEPDDAHERRGQDAAARVREEERDERRIREQRARAAAKREREREREVGRERELVPQADRPAQACDVRAAVVVEEGKDLAEERPDDHRTEQRREPVRERARARGRPQPERREQRVQDACGLRSPTSGQGDPTSRWTPRTTRRARRAAGSPASRAGRRP